MNTTITAFFFFLLAFSKHAYGATTVGTDFIFTVFNAQFIDEGGILMYAMVSNNNNGPVRVTVTSLDTNFTTIQVNVAAMSVTKIVITPFSIEAQYPKGLGNYQIVVENKGIRLTSDLPVAVYTHAQSYGEDSADTFLVLPTNQLGMQYVAVTSTWTAQSTGMNMIAVVAVQDNTQVTIGNQTTTLNALQVASLSSLSLLSGLTISANKPIAAFSGNTCGVTAGSGGCDYEAVMLLPVSDWGKQFAAIPFMYLNTNYYQVLANTDNTVVMAGTTQIATLKAGEYKSVQTGATLITSNNPILLIQIGENVGFDHNSTGDPFFLQLPSTDQMSNAVVLFQPTINGSSHSSAIAPEYFVRIVTVVGGTGEIQLDGATIGALQYKRVPNTAIYYYETKISGATHTVRGTSAAIQFSVISYSYSWYQGCGFVGSLTLPN